MKKYFVWLVAALLALAACEKNVPLEAPQEAVPTQLVVDFAPAYGAAPDTKAVKKGWEAGDVVFIYFEGVKPGYLKMSFDGRAWSSSLEGMQVSDLTPNGKKLQAVHYPFCPGMSIRMEGGERYYSESYSSWFLLVETAYTVDVSGDIATLSVPGGQLKLTLPDGFVQFFVADPEAVDGGAFLSETSNNIAPVVIDTTGTLSVRPLGAALRGYAYGKGEEKGYVFSGYLNPSRHGKPEYYSFRLLKGLEIYVAWIESAKTLQGSGTTGRAANISRLDWKEGELKGVPMYVDDEGNEYFFASMNLGATSEEDYGAYFAWGEVVKNFPSGNTFSRSFDWNKYKWGSASNQLIKYCPTDKPSIWGGSGAPDNKLVLDPEDDAATVWLGGAWRMPTNHEWWGLTANCDWKWTTVSGVNGYLVTGKGGYIGNKIFLPAAGVGRNTDLRGAGDIGCYWSSTLVADYPEVAWDLGFDDGNQIVSGYDRCYGLPIRAVFTLQ